MQRRHTPPSAALAPPCHAVLCTPFMIILPFCICCTVEEAHATQYGPYATMPPEQRTVSRYFSAAHMLEEAWSW